MSNAVTFAQKFKLVPGIALTAQQMAQLTIHPSMQTPLTISSAMARQLFLSGSSLFITLLTAKHENRVLVVQLCPYFVQIIKKSDSKVIGRTAG